MPTLIDTKAPKSLKEDIVLAFMTNDEDSLEAKLKDTLHTNFKIEKLNVSMLKIVVHNVLYTLFKVTPTKCVLKSIE